MLLVTPTCVVGLSALTLSSVSVGRTGGGVALRQLAWFGLGLIALVVVASLDYRKLVRIGPLFYVVGLAGLAGGFVLGGPAFGGGRGGVVGGVSDPAARVVEDLL